MTQEHPITPPPKLVHQWRKAPEYITELKKLSMINITTDRLQEIATQAARWGADTELEACCEWLSVPCPSYGRELRNARRPKPPSLKEQALEQLDSLHSDLKLHGLGTNTDTIRRALESLPS